jgi:hypothetical protein
MKLKRKPSRTGYSCYETTDGLWLVWQERLGPHFWYVNRKDCDETEFASGFRTKWEAAKALEEIIDNNRHQTPNELCPAIETYMKHRIECWLCMEADSTRDVTEAQFAQEMFDEGWRYISSEKFNSAGSLCPKCARTPDEKRGEDEDSD